MVRTQSSLQTTATVKGDYALQKKSHKYFGRRRGYGKLLVMAGVNRTDPMDKYRGKEASAKGGLLGGKGHKGIYFFNRVFLGGKGAYWKR